MSRDEKSWCDAFLDGMVRLHDDNTPRDVVRTFDDWHDGEHTAMFKFCRSKPVRPATLLREIEHCIKINVRGQDEADRLTRAKAWVENEKGVADAARSLRKAFVALRVAAKTRDLDPYFLIRIIEIAKDAKA